MKKFSIIGAAFILLYSCNNQSAEKINTPQTEIHKIDSFFPVTSYIKGQILILDSLPVTPLQITTINNKTDSAWLTKEKSKLFFAPFLAPVIEETNLTSLFRQTVFNDQTLNAITFTYDPVAKIPDSLSLRSWSVYVNPETGSVSKVYLVKQFVENGKTFTQQLTWHSNKSAKINTILNETGGEMKLLKEVSLIWNFSPAR